MKAWIVRFVSLYVFNVVVLLVIGLLTPAHVGFAVIWAAAVMTLAELFVRPFAQKRIAARAARDSGTRTKAGEAIVQTVVVLAVAAIIWVITLVLSGVDARGSWFWAWVLPPVIIAIGWGVYSLVSDKVEAQAGVYYDKAGAGLRGGTSTAPTTDAPATARGRTELDDGLTPEQRKMLDDLGRS